MAERKLKKGDKVVIHTCGEAEHHRGVIWTCKTDEYTTGEGLYRQDLIFLEGFSGSFLTKYLQFVSLDREEQLQLDLKIKEDGIARLEAMLETEKAQVEQLIAENERLEEKHKEELRVLIQCDHVKICNLQKRVAEQDKEIQRLNEQFKMAYWFVKAYYAVYLKYHGMHEDISHNDQFFIYGSANDIIGKITGKKPNGAEIEVEQMNLS